MAFEIDYIPVEAGEKSGDAIALRYGNLTGPRSEYKIVIIDGGFKESGQLLADHIQKYYNPENRIDLIISTHPDTDHASGLRVIFEEFYQIEKILMHRPWDHAHRIKGLFDRSNVTVSGIEKSLEDSFRVAKDLEEMAIERGVEIQSPFSGHKELQGVLTIIGPDKNFYERLLPHLDGTPIPAESLELLGMERDSGGGEPTYVRDYNDTSIDHLQRNADTTAVCNNTSVISLFELDGYRILFTGDAGLRGMERALQFAGENGIELSGIEFFDVPHHGSKRNLNTKIIKKLKPKISYISASRESKDHPAGVIKNALIKHGSEVCTTEGKVICYSHNAPTRFGWGPIDVAKFEDVVEI